MPAGMYELVEKILRAVSFIAISGAVALMFLAVFAQSITGSKRTHNQLDRLIRKIEKTNRLLENVSKHLKEKDTPEDGF